MTVSGSSSGSPDLNPFLSVGGTSEPPSYSAVDETYYKTTEHGYLAMNKDSIVFGQPERFAFVLPDLEVDIPVLPDPFLMQWGKGEAGEKGSVHPKVQEAFDYYDTVQFEVTKGTDHLTNYLNLPKDYIGGGSTGTRATEEIVFKEPVDEENAFMAAIDKRGLVAEEQGLERYSDEWFDAVFPDRSGERGLVEPEVTSTTAGSSYVQMNNAEIDDELRRALMLGPDDSLSEIDLSRDEIVLLVNSHMRQQVEGDTNANLQQANLLATALAYSGYSPAEIDKTLSVKEGTNEWGNDAAYVSYVTEEGTTRSLTLEKDGFAGDLNEFPEDTGTFPPSSPDTQGIRDLPALMEALFPQADYEANMRAKLEAVVNGNEFIKTDSAAVRGLLQEAGIDVSSMTPDQIAFAVDQFITENYTIGEELGDDWSDVEALATSGQTELSPEDIANLKASMIATALTDKGMPAGEISERLSVRVGENEFGHGTAHVMWSDANGVCRCLRHDPEKVADSLDDFPPANAIVFSTIAVYNPSETITFGTTKQILEATTAVPMEPQVYNQTVDYLTILMELFIYVANVRDQIKILDSDRVRREYQTQQTNLKDQAEVMRQKIHEMKEMYRLARAAGSWLTKVCMIAAIIAATVFSIFTCGAGSPVLIAVICVCAGIAILGVMLERNLVMELMKELVGDEDLAMWLTIILTLLMAAATGGAAGAQAVAQAAQQAAIAMTQKVMIVLNCMLQALMAVCMATNAPSLLIDWFVEDVLGLDGTAAILVKGIITIVLMLTMVLAMQAVASQAAQAAQQAGTQAQSRVAQMAQEQFSKLSQQAQNMLKQFQQAAPTPDQMMLAVQLIASAVQIYSAGLQVRVAQKQEVIADLEAVMILLKFMLGESQEMVSKILTDMESIDKAMVADLSNIIESAQQGLRQSYRGIV